MTRLSQVETRSADGLHRGVATVDGARATIESINAGDADAAGALLVSCESYLRDYVRGRIATLGRVGFDPEDVIQSVWVDLLRGLRDARWRFEDEGKLRALIARAASNRIIDRQRRLDRSSARERSLDDNDASSLARPRADSPSDEFRAVELWEVMLASTPETHRELLRLKREGLAVGEIAARTGLHGGSVRRILSGLARRMGLATGRPVVGATPPD